MVRIDVGHEVKNLIGFIALDNVPVSGGHVSVNSQYVNHHLSGGTSFE